MCKNIWKYLKNIYMAESAMDLKSEAFLLQLHPKIWDTILFDCFVEHKWGTSLV